MDLDLNEIADKVRSCHRCRLAKGRTNPVPGTGNPNTDLMLVGEGPGRQEDLQGEPFVGQAGSKLNEILASVSLEREDLFITNVVKCRPPENRTPRADEVEACSSYLQAQLAAINPSVIITLGNSSTRYFLERDEGITELRGEFYDWRGDIRIFPMYHPSYLLHNPSKEKGSPKYQTWQDIQKIKKEVVN